MDEKFNRGIVAVFFIAIGIGCFFFKRFVLGVLCLLGAVGYLIYCAMKDNKKDVRKNSMRNYARQILDRFEQQGYQVNPGLRADVDAAIDSEKYYTFSGRYNHKDFCIYTQDIPDIEKAFAVLAIIVKESGYNNDEVKTIADDIYYHIKHGGDFYIPKKQEQKQDQKPKNR